jgi:hypothetical protein
LCTLWKQSHEDGLIAPAPPESELAPDEDEGFFPDGALGSFYDPEAGDADDDDDYEYEPHVSATSSVYLKIYSLERVDISLGRLGRFGS